MDQGLARAYTPGIGPNGFGVCGLLSLNYKRQQGQVLWVTSVGVTLVFKGKPKLGDSRGDVTKTDAGGS